MLSSSLTPGNRPPLRLTGAAAAGEVFKREIGIDDRPCSVVAPGLRGRGSALGFARGTAVSDIRRLSCAIALAASLLWPLAATAQDKIRLGVLPFSESLAAIIADKQGFFKDEGL